VLKGALHALQELDYLKASHVSGASAGALVGGFLAAGLLPSDMLDPIFKLRREDFWDIGGNCNSLIFVSNIIHFVTTSQ